MRPSRQRLAPDSIYEAYVTDAGITGNDTFTIEGNYCCGYNQPCTNFDIVSGDFAPATMGIFLNRGSMGVRAECASFVTCILIHVSHFLQYSGCLIEAVLHVNNFHVSIFTFHCRLQYRPLGNGNRTNGGICIHLFYTCIQ